MRPVRRALLIAGLPLVLAACRGDDDDPVAITTTTVDPFLAFCEDLASLEGTDPFAAVEAATTPAEAVAAFDAGLDAISTLAEDAPDEIAPSVAAYVDGFEAFGDLLRAAEYNASRVDRDQLAAITEAVTTADAEINAFADEVC